MPRWGTCRGTRSRDVIVHSREDGRACAHDRYWRLRLRRYCRGRYPPLYVNHSGGGGVGGGGSREKAARSKGFDLRTSRAYELRNNIVLYCACARVKHRVACLQAIQIILNAFVILFYFFFLCQITFLNSVPQLFSRW